MFVVHIGDVTESRRHEGLPARAPLDRTAGIHAWVQFLVDELDRVFPTGDDPESVAAQDRLTRIWRRAVDLESAFFDEAYAVNGVS